MAEPVRCSLIHLIDKAVYRASDVINFACQFTEQCGEAGSSEAMPVPTLLSARRVYHFTHLDNLESLLEHGLLARNHSAFPAANRSVGDAGLQARRSQVLVPCGPGGHVHDYVPLYFGARSPMLFSISNRREVVEDEILYFEFPITLVERADVVFTEASAHTIGADGFFEDAADLGKLDWAAIDETTGESPIDDVRHRRMAELLVHQRLPITDALACIVRNERCAYTLEMRTRTAVFPPIEFQSLERVHWFG